jgi:hypothetical protein
MPEDYDFLSYLKNASLEIFAPRRVTNLFPVELVFTLTIYKENTNKKLYTKMFYGESLAAVAKELKDYIAEHDL